MTLLRRALLFLLLIGFGHIVAAMQMPEFTDPARAERLWELGPPEIEGDDTAYRDFKTAWYAEWEAPHTRKFAVMDTGIAISTVAVTMLSATLSRRAATLKTFLLGARTPPTLLHFSALCTIAGGAIWLSLAYAEVLGTFRRADPPWSDTPLAPLILISTLPPMAVIGTLILIVSAATFAPLPVGLWHWERRRPIRMIMVSLPFLPLLAIDAILFASAVADANPLAIVAALLSGYLLLCVRAALADSAPRVILQRLRQ